MVTVRGVTASLRWGYLQAAALEAYTVTKDDHGTWRLTATVVDVDAFRVAQRPVAFIAPHAKGAWRWPVTELQIAGASLTATLGPPEK
jgi:hypothetical protein